MIREDETVRFNVFGKSLTVSPGRVEFNRLHSRFIALAREQELQARESIEQFVANPEPLLKDGWAWALPYFSKAADLAVEELVKKECFDLDATTYLKEVFDRSPWERCCKNAFTEYAAIVAAEKRRELERDEQTDEAGEAWMGGGFGIGNAIKGAVQAEVLNFATAAISEGINAIGRSKSQKENGEKIRAVFNRRKSEIVRGVFSAIAEGAGALVKCLNEHGVEVGDAVSRSDEEKAERIFNNLKSGKIPADMLGGAKIDILRHNPYCREFYEYEYMTCGDPLGQLEKVASYFGISFESSKRDAFLARLGECPCTTEEETLAYRRKAVALAEEMKYDGSEKFAEIDARLKDIDQEIRTVCGRLFETRELASRQRELCALESAIDLSTEESALDARKMLLRQAASFGVDFSWKMSRVEETLEKFDREARTVEGHVFVSRETAFRQRKLCEFEQSLDVSTEAAALASKAALMAKIAELDVDGEWKTGRVNMAVDRFDREARTAFGRIYPGREDALAAKGEKEKFVEGILEVVRQCNHRAILYGAGITQKKVVGAAKYLGVHHSEHILALIDTSLFGSVKTGLALTSIGIRWKNPSASTTRNFVSWNELAKSMYTPTLSGRMVDFGNGLIFENCGLRMIPHNNLLALLQRAIGFSKEATFLS